MCACEGIFCAIDLQKQAIFEDIQQNVYSIILLI